eukprot:TRINITY_DN27989_c0_g1_i1.p1 TRINITY_DN27989_c0_g1~~TRINITY_DN27989_c0_g1_i1.p1  ORF type:complete len:178 (-),score=2.70 TRINITY_DN27989_c0_g1_i1:164-619(-)
MEFRPWCSSDLITYRKPIKMQATLCLAPQLPFLKPTKTSVKQLRFTPKIQTQHLSTKVIAMASPETVNYDSATSVFPAEACETVGGDACDAEMYPEVKLKPNDKSPTARNAQELVDREYFEYNESKTVFPDEACDDLGGEFCQPEYQEGVY